MWARFQPCCFKLVFGELPSIIPSLFLYSFVPSLNMYYFNYIRKGLIVSSFTTPGLVKHSLFSLCCFVALLSHAIQYPCLNTFSSWDRTSVLHNRTFTGLSATTNKECAAPSFHHSSSTAPRMIFPYNQRMKKCSTGCGIDATYAPALLTSCMKGAFIAELLLGVKKGK